MDFKKAYEQIKQGVRMKRASWTGYWEWNDEKSSIIMHCADGKELDIRETDDLDLTISSILADDWEKWYEPELTYYQAMEELVKGKCVSRRSWEHNFYLDKGLYGEILKRRGKDNTALDVYSPKVKDIKANDWYIVE